MTAIEITPLGPGTEHAFRERVLRLDPGAGADGKGCAFRTYENGLTCTWMNNARTHSAVQAGTPGVPNPPWVAPPDGQSADRLGYDGAGRAIVKRYVASGLNDANGYSDPTSLVGFTTGLDRAGNKFYERALQAEERSSLYEPFDPNTNLPTGGYDSLDRLLQYQRGILASSGGDGGNGGGSVPTPITLTGTDSVRSYLLDGLGNWRNTIFTPAGGSSTTEIRQHNGLNQITSYKRGSSLPVALTYDGSPGASNGNLTYDGTYYYTLDALNRIVEVDHPTNDDEYAFYFYDALNRRIRKHIAGGATTDCIYSGWQCVEDRNPDAESGDALIAQYIWGIYLDELIQVLPLVPTNGFPENSPLYPLQDLLYRTVGLADYLGVVREAYDFDAYGNTLIFRNSGSPPAEIAFSDSDSQVSSATCQFLFTGQRFDAETGLYYFKRRFYSPVLGRFLSRDPIKFPAGGANLYRYLRSRPVAGTDALGLLCIPDVDIPSVDLAELEEAIQDAENLIPSIESEVPVMLALLGLRIPWWAGALGWTLAVIALLGGAAWLRCYLAYRACVARMLAKQQPQARPPLGMH